MFTNCRQVLISRLLALSVFVLLSFVLFVLFSGFITNANADNQVSKSTDFEANVRNMLELRLTTCNDSDNTRVVVNVEPSVEGTFKSNCQEAFVNTNLPGYTLTAKTSSLTMSYMTPNTYPSPPTIASTTNTLLNPNILSNDTWGFAVENRLNFNSSYAIDNADNTYSQLPTTDITIYSETGWPLDETSHVFYYATRLTPATMAGTYVSTITYTVIGEPIKPIPCKSEVVICVEVTEPGVIAIQNPWNSPINYTINDSNPTTIASSALSSDLNVLTGDIIEVFESVDSTTFRSWISPSRGFITNTTSTGTARVSIIKMPAMNRFTTDNTGTIAEDSFFRLFTGGSTLNPATISSLPSGSFDISSITSVGSYFFENFNSAGALTSLPDGSFDTSSITSTGSRFFSYFNAYGALTSLPAGSFDTSNISGTIEEYFFSYFNLYGALTSLPAESFNISNVSVVGNNFFSFFNNYGALTSLPAESFNTGNITSVGNNYFSNFNSSGNLTSLPAGSFDTRNITSVGSNFFTSFNNSGNLTSLPAGSFDINKISSASDSFFSYFNNSGNLTSLPSGSFNTRNITSVGSSFFAYFNYSGDLTVLPVESFVTSYIGSAGANYFFQFNGSSVATAGRLQAGTGVSIRNVSSANVVFWRRPNGNPNGTATSTNVSIGSSITFLAE